MYGMGVRQKAPSEALDHTISYADRLGTSDTIATSTFAVDTGLTNVSDTNSDTTTSIRLSGGTAGQRYKVTNTVTTTDGEDHEQVFYVDVVTEG